MKLETSANQDN